MEFKLKVFETALTVSKIANVHFFEFSNSFSTHNDKHPFCELVFINTGYLHISSEDYTGLLKKNELIIHRANTLHSLSCDAENSPSVIIIGFECSSDKINYFSFQPIKLSDSNVKKLAEIVKEGRNVFMAPYNIPVYDMKEKKTQLFGAQQLLKNLLEYFLVELIREYQFNEKNEDKKDINTLMINEIINYINENFLEKITIDELAFLFRTNRASLCKEFKISTGKTLIGYIDEKKLTLAKDKIINTNKNFTEIATEMNFDTIHYFTRFFKKMTGLSPKAYRLSQKK